MSAMRRPQQDKKPPLTRKGDQLVLAARLANQSQKAMGWNTAFKELSELPLDEAGNVPVLLPFARKKRLQMFGDDLVKHGLLGLERTIGLSAIEIAGTFLNGCRFLQAISAFAGAVPSAVPDETGS